MRIPVFGGLWPIKPREALRDAFAGVTLASMNIPQVLGYTRIAGTPVVTGLYTVLLPLVAFAVFGSSRHLVVAADSATAAIFSSSLSRMATPASEHYMALVGMVALLTSGLLVLARIFKLGFLADFLSRTALIGFLTGVGVQVGTAMLGDMLGVNVASRRTLVELWQILQGLPMLDPRLLGLSLFCRRLHPARPAIRAEFPGLAHRGCRRDRRQRLAESCATWLSSHRAGSWRTAVAEAAAGHMERNPCRAPCRHVVLRDDHRPKRGDVAHLCHSASGAGRRKRRHPWPRGGERGRGGQRSLRRQRQSDADRDGGRGGRAKPGRTARLRRDRARRPPVPDGPAAISAALRAGEHRVHDRGRHGRCGGPPEHPSGEPRRIHAGDPDRRGSRRGRRRAGHSVRDRLLAGAARPPQLSGACDGARSGRERPVGSGAGSAWSA